MSSDNIVFKNNKGIIQTKHISKSDFQYDTGKNPLGSR